MPRSVDYPRNSLRRSVALTEAVDKLGGEASEEMVAEGVGQKIGGAFRAVVFSTVKYGLVNAGRGRIKTEPLFQDYKLAYSEAQKQQALRKAFLSVPLFKTLAERLHGQPVPGHLEKLLIREYDVPNDLASRVGEYFIEGAKDTGILGGNGLIMTNPPVNTTITPGTGSIGINGDPDQMPPTADSTELTADSEAPMTFVPGYTVRITGPGIDSRISIKDEEDVDIVEVMLKKVRRLIKAQTDGEKQTAG